MARVLCCSTSLEYALRDLVVRPPPLREGDMDVKPLYRLLGLLGLVAPLMTGAAAAQSINAPTTTTGRVIVGPVTGTLGLEASVDKFYSDVHKLVKVMGLTDGAKEARTRNGLEVLDTLTPGAPVVAHYAVTVSY